MAEEEQEEKEQAADDGEGGGGGGKKLLGLDKKTLMTSAGVLLLMPILAYVLVAFVINPALNNEESRLRNQIAMGEIYELPQVRVNLSTSPGDDSLGLFAYVQLGLEMNRKQLNFELDLRRLQLLDLLQDILRIKKPRDFKDPAVKSKLKREILDRFNAELDTGEVVNVYFTQLIIDRN